MNSRKKEVLSISLILVGLYLLNVNLNANTTIHASWHQRYKDLNELRSGSDLVAIGYIRESQTIPYEAGYYPSTLFDFEVTEVIYGVPDAMVIPVIQTGGLSTGGHIVEVVDDPLMERGDQLLLFLKKADTGNYFVVGGPQGRYVIEEDRVYSIWGLIGGNTSAVMDVNGLSLSDFENRVS